MLSTFNQIVANCPTWRIIEQPGSISGFRTITDQGISMNILGISAFYHDSAAALVRDGGIVAAVQEERFTRIKHDSRFPANAVSYCLREGGLTAEQLDYVVFYEKPLLKFERLLETYIGYAPRGFRQFLIGSWRTYKS